MRKLVWIFLIALLASACTTYTCPTYAQDDIPENKTELVDDTLKA